MIESFSDVILIAKILLTFLSRIHWETLSKFYKFGNLPVCSEISRPESKRGNYSLGIPQ
jgi:hypothetical protein